MTKPYQNLSGTERQKIEDLIENTAKQRTKAELEESFLFFYGYCLSCKNVVPREQLDFYQNGDCLSCPEDEDKWVSYKVVELNDD